MKWRKSSHSLNNGTCVEVAGALVTVAMRDSKDPDGPVLRFSRSTWESFVTGVKDGEFDD